jgi:MFS family permease
MNAATRPRMTRIGFSSIAGTALEYYDFAVYNTLAALVFNKLFFPTFDARAGLLLAFATYWVGYLSRPLGGILFGSLGDRRGRRYVLVVTLVMMGLTTTAIGCLPTYAEVGALAPALLVALRFLQGMALGGEWAGAVLLSTEHGSPEQRGRNAAWAQMGPSTGVLIATGAIALLTAQLSSEELEAWGWRLPLLASVVLVIFGLWLRLGVPETPEFQALEKEAQYSRAPLGEALRLHWRSLLIAGGSRFGPDVLYSFITAFLLAYITKELAMSRAVATTALAIGAAFNVAFVLFASEMSDRFGRRAVYGVGVALAAVWLWMVFPMLNSKNELVIACAVASGLVIHAIMYGPQGAFITEQFPVRVRYAGASLAYTFAGVFAGGLAPLALTGLFGAFRSSLVVILYVTGALVITAVALLLTHPRKWRGDRLLHRDDFVLLISAARAADHPGFLASPILQPRDRRPQPGHRLHERGDVVQSAAPCDQQFSDLEHLPPPRFGGAHVVTAIEHQRQQRALGVRGQFLDTREDRARHASVPRQRARVENLLRRGQGDDDSRQVLRELFGNRALHADRAVQGLSIRLFEVRSPVRLDLFASRVAQVVSDADRHAALATRPGRTPVQPFVRLRRGDLEAHDEVETPARALQARVGRRNLELEFLLQRGQRFRA